jgi:hypothetical protein
MCQPLDGAEVPLDFSPAIRHLEILMRWSDDFPGDQPIVSDDAERLRRAADILEGAEPTSEEAASPWIQYLLSERRDGDGAPSTLRFVAALFFDAPISNDTFRSRLDRAVEIVEGSPLTPDEEGEEWATLAFDAHRLTLSGPTASTSPAE